MRFFRFSLQNLFAVVERFSFGEVATRRRFSTFCKRNALKRTILTISSVAILTAAIGTAFDPEGALAQESGGPTPNSGPATPEEVAGASARDIDAIRVLSSNYLENPDGGEVPLDEDDAWLPELGLAPGAKNDARSGVRSISFVDGKPETKTIVGDPSRTSVASPTISAKRDFADSAAPRTVPTQALSPTAPGFGNYQAQNFSTAAPESASDVAPAPSVGGFENYRPTAPTAPEVADVHSVVPNASSAPVEFVAQNAELAPKPEVAPVPTPSAEVAPGSAPKEISLDEAKLSEADVDNLTIEDVRVSGLEMTTQQFNKIIKTRIGGKFNQQRLEEDKRALLQTKQFVDVAVSTTWRPDKPDHVVVNFDLIPRRLMKYIKFVGNRKVSRLDMIDELGVKPGETRMDPYEVENGRIRIIEFYKSKNLPEPCVEILSGDRPEDVGVVYLIDEGKKQRVFKTTFVGNKIASSARLKSLISVKPGVFYLIGGDFNRARLDEDVATLLEYYRKLGFFDARIDREYEEGGEFAGFGKEYAWTWIAVKYIVDEGPRYKIRNFFFEGNRVVSTPELKELLKVEPGSYYNYDKLEADRIALRYKYQDLGYVRADVTPTPLFTDEEGTLDVRFTISEDRRYRVRDIIVDYVGTESRTKKSVVWNLLDLSPGELLNGRKIRSSEAALQRSGYFNDKAAEGQLPEIAVVPDESRSFRVQKEADGTQTVKEARRLDADGSGLDGSKESENSDESDASPRRFGSVGRAADFRRVAYSPDEKGGLADFDETGSAGESGFRSRAYSAYSANAASSSGTLASAETGIETGFASAAPPLVRGQSRQVPTGFSSETTRPGSATANYSGYSGYESYESANGTSQYSGGFGYANYDSADLNAPGYGFENDLGTTVSTDFDANAPGFADGVYGSIARDVVEPISSPDDDEIYDGDVLVKIQEGRTGMFTASVGVNSDYGLVGNVSFEERNFDITRWPTALCRLDGWKDAFRGGGQIFKVQASPGTSVQRYSVSWDVPNVLNTRNTFGVTGLYGDRSYDEWFETRYGGELRLGRQWSNRFSTTVNGGLYKVKISNPAVNYVPDLNAALGSHNMFTVGLTGTYDERNHPFSPSEGYYLRGSAEMVLGSYRFPRADADARYYKTLHERVDGSGRWVLGLSSHVGWNGDDAPIYERFYGGGSTNLRGFEYRGVTPRYKNTGFGVGGNFEFVNTAELLIPLSGGDEFKFALFVDAGTVASKINDWGTFRVSPGFGFRLSIPMLGPAPLAIDFAFPVSKDSSDVTEVFSFGMSGSR